MKDITTGIIGSKLPTFKEYGDDKKVDFMISANNQLFQQGIPGALVSGVQILENGIIKVTLNIFVDMKIEEG